MFCFSCLKTITCYNIRHSLYVQDFNSWELSSEIFINDLISLMFCLDLGQVNSVIDCIC